MATKISRIELAPQTVKAIGKLHYFSIPKAFIDSKTVVLCKKYRITLELVEDEEKEASK